MTQDFASTGTQLYSQFIFKSRYSRWLEDKKRRETWPETVQRYIDFFKNRFPQLENEIQALYEPIFNLEVLPSMRALMTAGPALERDNCAIFNCSYLVVDSPRAFDEMMYASLCGVGVGFSVERQYINKLPEVSEEMHDTESVIVVSDSKIGWASAYRELVSLLYAGKVPSWDMHKVRPAGAPLKVFGGRASGPEPLEDLFMFTVNIFKKAKGRKLTSLECHDLICKIAEVVVVGGTRRSATLSLSNPSDERMRMAKSGQWWQDAPHRALANNSIAYTEKPSFDLFLKEWHALYESKSGERGMFNRTAAKKQAAKTGRREVDHDFGCNPCCFTGDMRLLTAEGYVRFDELSKREFVDIVNAEGNVTRGKVWSSGHKPVLRLTRDDGFVLKVTDDHIFKLSDGTESQALYIQGRPVASNIPGTVVNFVAEMRNYNPQHEDGSFTRETEEVFDFTEPETHWGVVEGCVVHNSEIILRPNSFCNLTEIVVRPGDTEEDLARKTTYATILGTLQSTVTDFRYLRSVWKKNAEEERLLGVSMTGVMDHPVLNNVNEEAKKILTTIRNTSIEVNKVWASKLGINQSTSITCIKPAGTTSQLTNTASGLHPRFSKYYIRRVRGDSKDPLCTFMKEAGFPCETDVMNKTNVVFSFPIKSPDNCVTVDDIGAMKQLEHWKMMQDEYCEHKPSITVYHTDEEFLEVGAWVWKNFDDISGISFLPKTDHVYKQAPYEAITEEKYNELAAAMPTSIDWEALAIYETEDRTTGTQELACSSGVCEISDFGSKSKLT